MANNKYGLIIPDKGKTKQPVFQAARNVFGNDSDSEDESHKKPILLRPSDNINRQAKITQEKAIMNDPTVYQYDEIYDSMKSEKEKKNMEKKEEKKPRYIENLIKSANRRKIENERRVERQIQKEREKEGDEFADKEVFVTSSYKKKLEEMRLEEEKEKYEEYLENIGDVTKQKDLGGFYRHLYEQKLGSDSVKDTVKEMQATDKVDSKDEKESFSKNTNKKNNSSQNLESTKKRNYRKRKSSAEHRNNLSEGEIEDSDEEINRINLEDIRKRPRQSEKNIDADSDFSIDDSSDEDDNQNCKKDDHSITNTNIRKSPKNTALDEKTHSKSNTDDTPIAVQQDKPSEPKPKIDIWKKRTVGPVFEDALKRYYERKAAKAS